MANICQQITRKKPVDTLTGTRGLHRCLTTLDLALIGVGAMVGSGIYVITGVAAKDLAGPSIIGSFLVASVIVCLAAACYTEFATRFHRTGSAYLYVYIALGELPAFVLGWCLITVIMCSASVSARAWSGYLDNILDGAIANFTRTHVAEWTVGTPIAEYPDLLGCAFVIIITSVLSLGANVSSGVNNIIVVINVVVLLFVAVVGFVYSDIENWTSEDTGGFMPYGIQGILAGSGACFWALAGFETISTTAEEAKTPNRSIPVATGVVVLLVASLYIAMSAAITLMTSYLDIDPIAPLPSAFQARGITWAQYVAAIGPMIGLIAMVLNCVYVAARFMYAISEDGLLPAALSKVRGRTKTPLVSTLLVGVITCLITVFLDLQEVLGFGIAIVLSQHIVVAIGVIILRYRTENDDKSTSRVPRIGPSYRAVHVCDSSNSEPKGSSGQQQVTVVTDTLTDTATGDDKPGEHQPSLDRDPLVVEQDKQNRSQADLRNNTMDVKFVVEKSTISLNSSCSDTLSNKSSTEITALIHTPGESVRIKPAFSFTRRLFQPCHGKWVPIAIFCVFVSLFLLSFLLIYGMDALTTGTWWAVLLTCCLCLSVVILIATIWVHQQNESKYHFKVPGVPVVPSITIFFCSVILVANTTPISWLLCIIIVALSLVVYFAYSVRHSKLNAPPVLSTPPDDTARLLGTDEEQTDEEV